MDLSWLWISIAVLSALAGYRYLLWWLGHRDE